MQKENERSLSEKNEGKVLIVVQSNNSGSVSHSFYVPKEFTIGHLKQYLNERILSAKFRQ